MRKWEPNAKNPKDPNIYTGLENMLPTTSGSYRTARQFLDISGATPPTVPIAADAFLKQDGTARFFTGTATKLYEGVTFTDRSRGGASYTSGTYWHGAQYGDVTIYTNYADNVQASSSGAFADLAGTPPKARYVVTQSLAVLLFNYNDGVNAYGDGWWASDIGSHTTWTPAAGNEAANGRLLNTPGNIVAAMAFRGDVIVFKSDSMYRMTYVGRPNIWKVQVIDSGIGAHSQNSVVNIGDAILFGNRYGWYIFDGAQARPVYKFEPTNATTAAPGNSHELDATKMAYGAHFEKSTGLVYFFHTALTRYVAYNVASDAWGSFFAFYSNSGNSNTNVSIVRGDQAAIVAAGLASADYLYTLCIVDGFNAKLTNNRLFWAEATSSQLAKIYTHFMGSEKLMTLFGRLTPILGAGPASGQSFSVGQCSLEAADDGECNITNTYTGPQNAGTLLRWDFSKAARFGRYVMFSDARPFDLLDYHVELKPAGTD